MNPQIWQNIATLPWWMTALYIYLFYLSYLATKPRPFQISNLYLLPCLLLTMAILNMVTILHVTPEIFGAWIAAMLVGTFFGYLSFLIMKIKPIKGQKTLELPGTWALLVIIPGFLIYHIIYGFQSMITLTLFADPKNANIILGLYGLLTGIQLGKLTYVRKYQSSME